MSADNGIYIAKFPDGYRVTHAQAIDNVDYFPEGTPERKDELKNKFGRSEVFDNMNDALNKARRLEKEIEDEGLWTEYGIVDLGEYESFE